MSDQHKARTGGQILVDALKAQQVDMTNNNPKKNKQTKQNTQNKTQETNQHKTCRQEGGAAYMAEAYGKLTGKPGTCFVTRGPGATNASIGVHTAYQDSTPMVLFFGHVGSDFIDRDAFLENNKQHMFAPIAIWVASVDCVERLP